MLKARYISPTSGVPRLFAILSRAQNAIFGDVAPSMVVYTDTPTSLETYGWERRVYYVFADDGSPGVPITDPGQFMWDSLYQVKGVTALASLVIGGEVEKIPGAKRLYRAPENAWVEEVVLVRYFHSLMEEISLRSWR